MLKLRDYQQDAMAAIEAARQEGITRQVVCLPTGCHRIGQGILMADGSIRCVEDIGMDDRLMGIDGTPRRVLALCRGAGHMVEVLPTKGNPWVVNDQHILTLVRINEKLRSPYPCHQRGGETLDISIQDYQKKSPYWQSIHKLFHAPGLDFPLMSAPLPFDPYCLGLFLGDGTLATEGRVECTKPDPEVHDALQDCASRYGMRYVLKNPENGQAALVRTQGTRQENPIAAIFRDLKISGIKGDARFIPKPYLVASRTSRLELLAGLIDTDGSYGHGYDWISKSPQLARDMAFLARSVGLCVTESIKHVTNPRYRDTPYCRLSISGNLEIIPCRIPRKKASPRLQKKDALRTGFTLNPTGTIEPYYGFILDGDQRYLLEDCTVTHNSGKTIIFSHLVAQYLSQGRVIILCHRDELLKQTRQKLLDILPDAQIGMVKAEVDETRTPIVLASVQTLARTERLHRLGQDWALVIADECHHCSGDISGNGNSWARSLAYLAGYAPEARQHPLVVGMTATPFYADGKPLVQSDAGFFQKIVYFKHILEMIEQGYLVAPEAIRLAVKNFSLDGVRKVGGEYSANDLEGRMLAVHAPDQLAEGIMMHAPERRLIAFSPGIEMAEELATSCQDAGLSAETIIGSTPTEDRDRIYQDMRDGTCQVISSVMVLTEGFDLPAVDAVLLARATTSKVLYQQAIGRGLRLSPQTGKTNCIVLDATGATERNNLYSMAEMLGLLTPPDDSSSSGGERAISGGDEDDAQQLEMDRTLVSLPARLLRNSAYAWIKTQRGAYVLSLPEQTIIRVIPHGEAGDKAILQLKRQRDVKQLIPTPLPIAHAFGIGEDTARSMGWERFSGKEAAWLQRPASDKQAAFARKLGISVSPTATAGELSVAIAKVTGDW